MFSVNGNKGFHITFKNGYTLSTQFGYGNYCDNYMKEDNKHQTTCNNSEIAIICPNGDFMYLKDIFKELFNENIIDDVVKGKIECEQWFKILEYVKNIKE